MAGIEGLDALLRKLGEMGKAAASQAVGDALTAGAQLIVNEAKLRAPVKTGTLKRYLHSSKPTRKSGRWEVQVGTNLRYAAIHEYGGIIKAKNKPFLVFKIDGKLIFTKSVQIPARPYLRPAFDSQKDAAITEVGEALAELVRQSAQ